MTEFCKACDGWGLIEVDNPRPHNFNRDVGCYRRWHNGMP